MQTISISKANAVASPVAPVEAVSEALPSAQQTFSSILDKQRKQSGSQIMDQTRKPQANAGQMPKNSAKESAKMAQAETAQASKLTDAKARDLKAGNAKSQTSAEGALVSEDAETVLLAPGQKLPDLMLLPTDQLRLDESQTAPNEIASISDGLLQMQAQIQAQMPLPAAQILPSNNPAGASTAASDFASDASAGLNQALETLTDQQDTRRTILNDQTSEFAKMPNMLKEDALTKQKSGETWLQNALPMSGVDTGNDQRLMRRIEPSTDMAVIPANAGQNATTAISLSANAMQQVAQGVGSTNLLNSAPGKSGWDQAMSQKIVWMLGTGTQSAEFTLNPPDLGPLQVVIQVNNDQANTQFMSDNPAVRQALEAGLDQLREKLSEAGVQLGQTSVSSGGRQQSGYGQAAHDASRASESGRNSSIAPLTEPHSTPVRSYGSNGLINTFA